MTRRGGTVPGLRVRVSHEATRLSQAHVAAAFERLVPVLERQTHLSRAEADKHGTDAARGGAKPTRRERLGPRGHGQGSRGLGRAPEAAEDGP